MALCGVCWVTLTEQSHVFSAVLLSIVFVVLRLFYGTSNLRFAPRLGAVKSSRTNSVQGSYSGPYSVGDCSSADCLLRDGTWHDIWQAQ